MSRAPASLGRRLQRPLAALWISVALHAALAGLVQLAPPASTGAGPVIAARLVLAPAAPQAADAVPVPSAEPTADSPDPSSPAAAETPPAAADLPDEPAPTDTPRTGIESAVDLTYYTARQVDVQPRALAPIVPAYPPEAEVRRQSGTVRLRVKLEADGRVSAVEVVSADPPGVFDAAALRAFGEARFAPGERAGRPVRMELLIEVTFDWAGRGG